MAAQVRLTSVPGGCQSCKQLLQTLVCHRAGADNAGMTSPRIRLALLLAAAALAGCVVMPAYDHEDYDPAPAVTVYAAPPAPLVEYRGLPPAYGYVWLDGYWNWGGGTRYSWVPGRWANPPPGRVWVPRVWQRDGERWHAHGGHWEQHREDRRRPPQFVSPRHEFQPQPQPVQRPPEPWRRPESRPEPQPEPPRHPSRDGAPPPAFSRPSEQQPPVQGVVQPAPEPHRRPEGPLRRVMSGTQRMSPDVAARPEPPPRPAEAAPQRREPDEGGRRIDRRRPDDGEPRDRHRVVP